MAGMRHAEICSGFGSFSVSRRGAKLSRIDHSLAQACFIDVTPETIKIVLRFAAAIRGDFIQFGTRCSEAQDPFVSWQEKMARR
jgi:hypothetical protein